MPNTNTAEEVCAGKITTQAITMGIRTGMKPSFMMRCCLGVFHVQNIRLGTICSVRIVDCRSAKMRAK